MKPIRTLCNVGMKSYKYNECSGKVRHCLDNVADKKFQELEKEIQNKNLNDDVKFKALQILKEEREFRKKYQNKNLIFINNKFSQLNPKKDYWTDIDKKIQKKIIDLGKHNLFPLREFCCNVNTSFDTPWNIKQEIGTDLAKLQNEFWKSKKVKIAFIVVHLNEDSAKTGKIHTHTMIDNSTDSKWGWCLGYMKKKDLVQLQQDYEDFVFKPLAKKYPEYITYIDIETKKKKQNSKSKQDIWDLKLNKVIDEATVDTQNQLINDLVKELEEKNDFIEKNLTIQEKPEHIINNKNKKNRSKKCLN